MRSLNRLQFATALAVLMLFTMPLAQGAKAQKPYVSPLGNFSVPIPSGQGMRMNKQGDKDGGNVSFHSDWGTLRAIFHLRLSPRSLALAGDRDAELANLEAFLDEYALPTLFRQASPSAAILHREHLTFADAPAVFAVVDLPGASVLEDARTKRRMDTRRGLLLFTRGAFLYMLSSGENPTVLDLGRPPAELASVVDGGRRAVTEFAGTLTFH